MRFLRATAPGPAAVTLAVALCLLSASPCPARAGTAARNPGLASSQNAAREVLVRATRGTPAVAVVLDFDTGKLIAAERPKEAAQLAAAPGSVLKPFFLAQALQDGLIHAEVNVFCNRSLHIGGRNLACTHPAGIGTFDAERALAYSCNTYFAALAARFSPQREVSVLRSYGIGERPRVFPNESEGVLRQPETEEALKLMVLGLEDSQVTAAQLARAYWHLARDSDTPPAVMRGLRGSVSYGMARPAATDGVELLGKTGTASDPQEAWTHGWFAGIASRHGARIVLVLYVPHGSGGDAAVLAHRFLSGWRPED